MPELRPTCECRDKDSSWQTSCAAFTEAATWFVGTAALVGEHWTSVGLGEWDVRSLVGHTSRALLTVETYLGTRADRVEVHSTVDYYRATSALTPGADVAARGRDAGAALGSDPAGALADIAARVTALVATCDGTELVTTIAGGMRLADYLPTRTFELVVHTSDLAVALGLPPAPPVLPASQALELVARLAAVGGTAGELLLAVTGRRGLPQGFSVL